MPRKVSYLKLPKSEVHIKTFGLVSGWGDTIFSNGETSEPSGMLKYLIVEIKNVNECRQDLIHSNYEKVLCVYPSLNGTKLAKASIPLYFFNKNTAKKSFYTLIHGNLLILGRQWKSFGFS